MKRPLLIAAIMTLSLSILAFAQDDGLEPGIYAVTDGGYRPLTYSSSTFPFDEVHEDGSHVHKYFDGESSGVEVTGTFIMVVGDDSDFFVTVTPSCMKLLPLEVDTEGHMREYDATSVSVKVDFEWDRISEDSFQIKVFDCIPGEYAFILRNEGNRKFNYNKIYGFKISEP